MKLQEIDASQANKARIVANRGKRKARISVARELLPHIVIFFPEVFKALKKRRQVTPLMYRVLVVADMLQGTESLFTASDLRKAMHCRQPQRFYKALKALVTLGYLDQLRNHGGGKSARYSINGNTSKLFAAFSYELRKIAKERNFHY